MAVWAAAERSRLALASLGATAGLVAGSGRSREAAAFPQGRVRGAALKPLPAEGDWDSPLVQARLHGRLLRGVAHLVRARRSLQRTGASGEQLLRKAPSRTIAGFVDFGLLKCLWRHTLSQSLRSASPVFRWHIS